MKVYNDDKTVLLFKILNVKIMLLNVKRSDINDHFT